MAKNPDLTNRRLMYAFARSSSPGLPRGLMDQRMVEPSMAAIAQKAVVAFGAALSVALVAAQPACSQWWNPFAPKDYEGCADQAARDAKSAQALSILLSSCRTKFIGRRKPGGQGYTYYDPRQIRSFDIEGPNPTEAEWDYINHQYSIYQKEQQRLEEQRRAAEAKAEQQRLEEQRRAAEAKAEQQREEQEAAERKAAAAAAAAVEAERQRREQEEAKRAAEAAAAADFKRRMENAQRSLTFLSKSIECRDPLFGCGLYRVNVTVQNRSPETITSISLGWSFYPRGGGSCPSSYETRRTSTVYMLPDQTVTLNVDGFGAPEQGFGYCIGITGVRIL